MNVRALNRALLARQHLLERSSLPVPAMLGHLVGMQAQAPLAPYVGLWTRLDRFRPEDLASLLSGRRAVRGLLMRGTVHLVLAEDARVLRPLVQRVVANGYTGHFGRRIGDADLGAVVHFGRQLLEARPRTRRQLQDALAARWPEHDAEALSYAVGYLVRTAQVRPRGVWGSTGPATLTTLDGWLGGTAGVRPGFGRRRPGVVGADEAAGDRGADGPADVPRGVERGAVRRRGRRAAGPGHPGGSRCRRATALPAEHCWWTASTARTGAGPERSWR
ncbi:hypothetical protein GCM10017567_87470 [Amycolatopsis bullii]|uniref:Winged helix DNA-binding domain-containing protein n=1 Tax=Amycolatopsis bullii TaxID=941987 RepID=A0ABQ3KU31_9PSEU|nr:hypothetical protein GCM10017567_87470 [Amycolatopsis bullii]